MSYSTLWEYTVKYLGYSESGASERLNALKLFSSVPEIKEQLQSGKLNMTTVSTVQRFVQASEKEQGKIFTREEKQELVNEVIGKSSREVELILEAKTEVKIKPKETFRAVKIADDEVGHHVSFIASSKLIEQIKRYKELHGQKEPNEIFEELLDRHLDKKDPARKENSSAKSNTTIEVWAPKVNETKRSRYISKKVQRMVLDRANHQCEFQSPVDGQRCQSRTQLQLDHIIPFSAGGTHDESNLRALCPTHNQFMAAQYFGREKMDKYGQKKSTH